MMPLIYRNTNISVVPRVKKRKNSLVNIYVLKIIARDDALFKPDFLDLIINDYPN